jgi:hypothetical protein
VTGSEAELVGAVDSCGAPDWRCGKQIDAVGSPGFDLPLQHLEGFGHLCLFLIALETVDLLIRMLGEEQFQSSASSLSFLRFWRASVSSSILALSSSKALDLMRLVRTNPE